MAAVTARTMILSALRKLGLKAPGDTLTSAEETAHLGDINAFMDSLGIERLMVPYITEDSLSLTSSDGVYTIGPGADFNTVRPLRIEQAWIRDSDDADTPVEVFNDKAYNSIPLKTVDGSYPSYLYYDSGFQYRGQGLTGAGVGWGTIKLYPEPGSGLTLYITSLKPLQQFGTLDVPIQLPPGYQRFIEHNLALELAGDMPIPAVVVDIAKKSKAAIKSFNLPGVFLRLDAGIVSSVHRGSILTGP